MSLVLRCKTWRMRAPSCRRTAPKHLVELVLPRHLHRIDVLQFQVDRVPAVSVSPRRAIVVVRWNPNIHEPLGSCRRKHGIESGDGSPVREEMALVSMHMGVKTEIDVGVGRRHELEIQTRLGGCWFFVSRRIRGGEGDVVWSLFGSKGVAAGRKESAGGCVGWTGSAPCFPDALVRSPIWDEFASEYVFDALRGVLDGHVGKVLVLPRNENASLGIGVDGKVHVRQLDSIGRDKGQAVVRRTSDTKSEIIDRNPLARALTSESS